MTFKITIRIQEAFRIFFFFLENATALQSLHDFGFAVYILLHAESN